MHVTGLVPRPLIDHVAYSTTRLMLLIGACAGLLLRKRWTRGDAFLLVTAASVIGVQTVFFPTSRLLAPMAFVLMVYTACALAAPFDRTGERVGRVQPSV